MAIHVKICGITSPEDAQAAVEAGANALGLVFAPSPRRVTIDQARLIARSVPGIDLVGVFVGESGAFVREAVTSVPLTSVQRHRRPRDAWSEIAREEWALFTASRRVRTIEAFAARDAASLREELAILPADADQVLLDAFVPGAEGGTGKTFDWTLVEVAREFGRPIIIAGGLTAENVAEAVRLTRPWGVDVSSGVESAPGIKDHDLMRRFVANASVP